MKLRHAQGFTLVEVMVAIIIFAIGFTGLLTMSTGTAGSNATAVAISGATEMAAQQLEHLTTLAYDDTQLQDTVVDTALNNLTRNPLPSAAQVAAGARDVPDPVARPAEYGPFRSADNLYTIYWNVADNTPVTDTKTIVVIVTSTGLGPQKTVALQHILMRRI